MSQKSAEELRLQRVYNSVQQCIVILQELARTNPGLRLPKGEYAMADRPLDRICNFLVTELRGIQQDTGLDPSAGAATSEEQPDGKTSEDA